MRSLFNLLFILTAVVNSTHAQSLKSVKQVIATGGGHSQNGNIMLTYTLGQSTAIDASFNESTVLQQGFQTGAIAMKPSVSPEPNQLEVSVSPNPTTEKITIRHSEKEPRSFRLILFDLDGRRLEEQTYVRVREISTSFRTKVKGVYQLAIECLETEQRAIKTLIFL